MHGPRSAPRGLLHEYQFIFSIAAESLGTFEMRELYSVMHGTEDGHKPGNRGGGADRRHRRRAVALGR